mmetsp:Transcript_24243/g.55467  ORF Transcript_24243/g.55467 Transcript_24243/m.55467 type:complete len:203 (-) Transcript_24243:97-705(-)
MFGTAQPTRELHFLLSSRRTPRRGTDRSQVRRQFPFRRLATPHFKGCPASSFHTYCGRLKGARAQPAAPERDPFIPPPFPASIMHLDLLGPPLASAPNDQRLAPHLAHIQRFDQIALRQLRVPRLTRARGLRRGRGGTGLGAGAHRRGAAGLRRRHRVGRLRLVAEWPRRADRTIGFLEDEEGLVVAGTHGCPPSRRGKREP